MISIIVSYQFIGSMVSRLSHSC